MDTRFEQCSAVDCQNCTLPTTKLETGPAVRGYLAAARQGQRRHKVL